MTPNPKTPNPPPSRKNAGGRIVTIQHRPLPPLPKAPQKAAGGAQKPASRPKPAAAATKAPKPAKAVQKAPEAASRPKMPQHAVISDITDPVRWKILCVMKGKMTPQDIGDALDMKSPNVQYHLKNLVDAGVVTVSPHPEVKNRFLYERRDLRANVVMQGDDIEATVEFD